MAGFDPEYEVISPTRLRSVSYEHFQTSHYGDSATRLLDQLKRQEQTKDLAYILGPAKPTWQQMLNMTIAADEIWYDRDDETPFIPDIRYADEESWSIHPGRVLAGSLCRFMAKKGLPFHELKGGAGRIIDVLGLASGAMRTPNTSEDPVKTEYVALGDLFSFGHGRQLTTYAQRLVMDRMTELVWGQITTGRSDPFCGEMYIDGTVSFGRAFNQAKPEKIAAESLGRLAYAFRLGSGARNFLSLYS